jgi:hypothetical protein
MDPKVHSQAKSDLIISRKEILRDVHKAEMINCEGIPSWVSYVYTRSYQLVTRATTTMIARAKSIQMLDCEAECC